MMERLTARTKPVTSHDVSGLFSATRRNYSPRSFPLLTRPSYLWEVRSAMSFPFAMACLEGGVIGVVARKTFGADELTVGAVAAAPMIANLSSFWWARMFAGRDRAKAVVILQSLTIACVAAIALLPITRFGLWGLVAIVYLARCALAGMVTARADIWRSNYPRAIRATIVGRFAGLIALNISLTAAIIGVVMQASGAHAAVAFRLLFLTCAVMAVGGAWAMSHVHWRGGSAQRAHERLHSANGRANQFGASGMLEVLRHDEYFRAFMTAQFVLGMSSMAGLAPFIIAIDEELKLGYAWSLALTQVIPTLLIVTTIPLWGRVLGQVHVVRFRAWHALLFVIGNALTGLGLGVGSLLIVTLSRAVMGASEGGGRIAWNIGHHDFAPRRLATLYMGVHVTLTGVRGAIASFLGVLLYAGWRFDIAGETFAFPGMNYWLFILLAMVSAASSVLFAQLERRMRAAGRTRSADMD